MIWILNSGVDPRGCFWRRFPETMNTLSVRRFKELNLKLVFLWSNFPHAPDLPKKIELYNLVPPPPFFFFLVCDLPLKFVYSIMYIRFINLNKNLKWKCYLWHTVQPLLSGHLGEVPKPSPKYIYIQVNFFHI